AEGRDIFRVFTLASEIYPESAEAWAAQGRVLAFVGQWRAAEQAYARAAALRRAQPLIARLLALARRREHHPFRPLRHDGTAIADVPAAHAARVPPPDVARAGRCASADRAGGRGRARRPARRAARGAASPRP